MRIDRPSKTLWIDGSGKASLAACETAFVMRHVYHYAPLAEAVPLALGNVYHSMVASHFDGRSPSQSMTCLSTEWDALVEPLRNADNFPKRALKANVERVARGWIDSNPLEGWSLDFSHGHTEIEFDVPLCSHAGWTIRYYGRADWIGPSADDPETWWIVETKTTSIPDEWWIKRYYRMAQLNGYRFALASSLPGGARVGGVLLNVIHAGEAPASPRKCARHGMPYEKCGGFGPPDGHMRHSHTSIPITAERQSAWLELAKATAKQALRFVLDRPRAWNGSKGLARTLVNGTMTDRCTICDFDPWCMGGAGRSRSTIKPMLVKRDWQPFQVV